MKASLMKEIIKLLQLVSESEITANEALRRKTARLIMALLGIDEPLPEQYAVEGEAVA